MMMTTEMNWALETPYSWVTSLMEEAIIKPAPLMLLHWRTFYTLILIKMHVYKKSCMHLLLYQTKRQSFSEDFTSSLGVSTTKVYPVILINAGHFTIATVSCTLPILLTFLFILVPYHEALLCTNSKKVGKGKIRRKKKQSLLRRFVGEVHSKYKKKQKIGVVHIF